MRRHLWILLLSLAFALASLAWIFHFPFRPALVLRAVPAAAVAATWHQQPYARTGAILKSTPAVLALAAAGISPAEAQATLEDPGTQALVKRLGGTATTLAFAPAFGVYGDPALILGAWVGGLSTHLMRAGFMNRSFDGYAMHRIGADRLWIGRAPDMPPTMRYISFGVYEGVLAGCASSDPFAAAALLAALRRHGPLSPLVSPWVDKGGGLKPTLPPVPDRFRVRWLTAAGRTVAGGGTFQVGTNGSLRAGWRQEDPEPPGAWPRVLEPPLAPAGDLLTGRLALPDDVPAVRVSTTLERGVAAAELLPAAWRGRLLLVPLAAIAAPGADLTVWIAGGLHSGRIMRMKVPSAGLAVRIPDGTGIETVAAKAADAMNAVYRAGLIAVPDRTDRRLYTFQAVKDAGVGGWIGTDERPAVAILDGRLIVMTAAGALRRLLPVMEGTAPVPEAGQDGAGTFWLHGQARLPDAAKAASGALAGYALLRLMQTGHSERLDSPPVQRLLSAMAGLGSIALRVGHDRDGCLSVHWTSDGVGGDPAPTEATAHE